MPQPYLIKNEPSPRVSCTTCLHARNFIDNTNWCCSKRTRVCSCQTYGRACPEYEPRKSAL